MLSVAAVSDVWAVVLARARFRAVAHLLLVCWEVRDAVVHVLKQASAAPWSVPVGRLGPVLKRYNNWPMPSLLADGHRLSYLAARICLDGRAVPKMRIVAATHTPGAANFHMKHPTLRELEIHLTSFPAHSARLIVRAMAEISRGDGWHLNTLRFVDDAHGFEPPIQMLHTSTLEKVYLRNCVPTDIDLRILLRALPRTLKLLRLDMTNEPSVVFTRQRTHILRCLPAHCDAQIRARGASFLA